VNESEKRTHAAVQYENPSTHGERECWRCEHYLGKKESGDGKPACDGVQRPIAPGAYCIRFEDVFRELK
jgi:hypothetical protein